MVESENVMPEYTVGDPIVMNGEHRIVVGFTAPKENTGRALVTKKIEEGSEYAPIVPRGWTMLKHGTNLLKWGDETPFTVDKITIDRPLSVITQEDFERDRQHGPGYNTTKSYSRMGVREGGDRERSKPFEIRIFYYQNHARTIVDPEYREALSEETMNEIKKYYFLNMQGGRHPLVPMGTTLIKLGHKQEDGVDVFYFVPQHLLSRYILESKSIKS